eukprot:553595-Pyramimonas_sp.AAC.1
MAARGGGQRCHARCNGYATGMAPAACLSSLDPLWTPPSTGMVAFSARHGSATLSAREGRTKGAQYFNSK